MIDIANPGHERDSPRWREHKGSVWLACHHAERVTQQGDGVRQGRAGSETRWAGPESTKALENLRNSWDVHTAAVLLEIALFQFAAAGALEPPAAAVQDGTDLELFLLSKRRVMSPSLLVSCLRPPFCSSEQGGEVVDAGIACCRRLRSRPTHRQEKQFYRNMARRRGAISTRTSAREQASSRNARLAQYHDVGHRRVAPRLLRGGRACLIDTAKYQKRTGDDAEYAVKDRAVRQRRLPSAVLLEGRLVNASAQGWTAHGFGRFFATLKVLSTREPQYDARLSASYAETTVKRMVKGGYLYGRKSTRRGSHDVPGRTNRLLAYMATGFSQWGRERKEPRAR